MIDVDALVDRLRSIGLDDWPETLIPLIENRLSTDGHGDFGKWQKILSALPDVDNELRELLLGLSPWRKGPLDIGGIIIDTEWRSDLKWNRLKDGIAPLVGRNVLDVGCGNGYYSLQMTAAGARSVIGNRLRFRGLTL